MPRDRNSAVSNGSIICRRTRAVAKAARVSSFYYESGPAVKIFLSAAIDKKNKIGYIQLVVTNICSVSMLGMTNKKEKGFEYGNDTDYFFHHYRECLQAG